MTSVDRYSRSLDYLRVSVTDRCNLRCVYCMPPAGVPARRHDEILSLEQIAQLVAAAAGMGFRKIRLTGGEPLVRKGIVSLVGMLAATPGVDEVAMTTNAILLASYAEPLAHAGLRRVNISLDTRQPSRFQRVTRLGDLGAAWQGIQAAEAAGLAPLKINVVVIRDVNDDELAEFAALTRERPWHVRFIEVMPLEGVGDWGPGMPGANVRLVTAAEMRSRLERLGPLLPDPGPGGHGPRALLSVAQRGRHHRLHQSTQRPLLRIVQPASSHRRRLAARLSLLRCRCTHQTRTRCRRRYGRTASPDPASH